MLLPVLDAEDVGLLAPEPVLPVVLPEVVGAGGSGMLPVPMPLPEVMPLLLP